MVKRRKARILAFQALFYWEASGAALEDLISFSWIDGSKLNAYRENGTDAYAKLLIAGAIENISEIDKKINERLEHWDISRLNRVDLAILRLSAYSLMRQKEIPASIIIDEAVELCREFGSDASYKFINGVLDGMRKALAKEGSA